MSGLNKLLLGVNPKSGRPDHMLNIVKFVTYNSWLPQQALMSVKILTYIMRQPNISPLLLGEFTQTVQLANEIRHGFVECLESDLIVSDTTDDEHAEVILPSTGEQDNVEQSIKESIINLLEECLPQSAPNLAHYLLGFDITKDVRATLLQQPGVMEFPSNCIKSLITILDDGLEQMKMGLNLAVGGQDRLIQSAYRLLYSLCFNSKTSSVVLR